MEKDIIKEQHAPYYNGEIGRVWWGLGKRDCKLEEVKKAGHVSLTLKNQ